MVYKLPTQPASGQIAIDCGMKKVKMSVDTGMMIVIFISMMYLAIVFVLLFYVGNEWCDLLYKNMTVLLDIRLKCFFLKLPLNHSLCTFCILSGRCLLTLIRPVNNIREEDNRQCGQSSVRTIVSADNCQCGQLSGDSCQGGHFSNTIYFKTYHVWYRWKGLDF